MTDRTAALEQQIRRDGRAAVIINTQSRRGRRLADRACHALAERGIIVEEMVVVRNPVYLRSRVQRAVGTGHRFIIVGGGDGTISSAVGAFAYRDVVLGVLPLGTGNSFAQTLGIPLTLDGALDVLLHGKVADVDLGKVGETYFANIVDIGMSADMAWHTSNRLKRWLGKLAYVVTGARMLLGHQAFQVCFSLPGGAVLRTTHEIIIANGRYYGDTLLDAAASVEDQRLTVYAMEAVSRWRLARLWLHFLRKRRGVLSSMQTFSADEMVVATDPPQYIDIDGEALRKTPARFTVAPNALLVLVPQAYPAAG